MRVCLVYRIEEQDLYREQVEDCRDYWEAEGFSVEEKSVTDKTEADTVMSLDGTKLDYCVFWGDIGFHCPISNGSFALNRIRNCINIVFLSKESYLKDMEDQEFSLSTYLLMDKSFAEKYLHDPKKPNVAEFSGIVKDFHGIRKDSVERLRIGERERKDGDRLLRELTDYETNKVGVSDKELLGDLWKLLIAGDPLKAAEKVEHLSGYYRLRHPDTYMNLKRVLEIIGFEVKFKDERMLAGCAVLDDLVEKQKTLEDVCETFAYGLGAEMQEKALKDLMRLRFSAVAVLFTLRSMQGCAPSAYDTLAAFYQLQQDEKGSALLKQH
ncbi:MAG: hypothetical protein K6G07_06120 [Lachnospiraceae bacterium]|nr:hypothetical protein [Lachnospiraceae bacterium]